MRSPRLRHSFVSFGVIFALLCAALAVVQSPRPALAASLYCFVSPTPNQDGTIASNEYGVQSNGFNQQVNGSQTWYMTWDDTNLYVGIANASIGEGAVLYIGSNDSFPTNGGTNANGNLAGQPYDSTNFSALLFRANFVTYFKNGYREYRTSDGSGGWSGATTGFGSYGDNGGSNVRELAIPWSAITGSGRPASFNWFGYVTSAGGFVYGQMPTGNPSGTIGTSATESDLYTVSDTTQNNCTAPFSADQNNPNPPGGSTFTVNVTTDSANGTGSGFTGNLRYAINSANLCPVANPCTVQFSVPNGSTILVNSQLTVSQNMTIIGPGAKNLTISGGHSVGVVRVFSVASINGLTIANGNNTDPGGGIANYGTLTISNSVFSDNTAGFDGGGGIANEDSGILIVNTSSFSGNSVAAGGGGILNLGMILMVSNSTFSGNSAFGGGGIHNASSVATLTISNSTFSGNIASGNGAFGGGIANGGVVNGGTLNLFSTIVAGNATANGATNPDISGAVNSLGYNLIGDGTGATGITNGVNHDQVGTSGNPINPQLGPLANNGGSTQTMALPVNGPAYQAGNCAGNNSVTPNAPVVTQDQRGQSRKSPCDIGAFEETFTFNPNSLPNGIAGNSYSATSTVTTGGTGPYSYASSAPTVDGLTVTASGSGVALNGTPTAQGVFNFTITATDTNGVTGSIYYTLTVSNPTPTPTNTPTNTSTFTPTFTPTDTFTPSNTPTNTDTFTPTNTPTNTYTPGNTPTSTNTLTPTSTPTPSNTPTNTNTFAPTSTPTNTNTLRPTNTPTSTNTSTNTAMPSNTPTSTPTNTPIPPRIDTIGVFRNSAVPGTFFLRLHNSTGIADLTVAFNPAVKPYPVVGDWTGAGFDTVGIFDQNNGLFSLCNANNTTTCINSANVTQLVLGNTNDTPLGGKWNNGFTHFGVGVFRPSNGLIYLKNNLTTGFADDTMVLGIPGDTGLAGDGNGDGFDSPGVYRASNQHFYLTDQVCNCSPTANYSLQYGVAGDLPITGDWIGQGHDSIGLFRQSNGFTYLKNGLATGFADITFTYGVAGDVPVAGHYQLVYPPAPKPGSVLVPPTAAPTGGGLGNGLQD